MLEELTCQEVHLRLWFYLYSCTSPVIICQVSLIKLQPFYVMSIWSNYTYNDAHR